jgi:hypothetical protein
MNILKLESFQIYDNEIFILKKNGYFD